MSSTQTRPTITECAIAPNNMAVFYWTRYRARSSVLEAQGWAWLPDGILSHIAEYLGGDLRLGLELQREGSDGWWSTVVRASGWASSVRRARWEETPVSLAYRERVARREVWWFGAELRTARQIRRFLYRYLLEPVRSCRGGRALYGEEARIARRVVGSYPDLVARMVRAHPEMLPHVCGYDQDALDTYVVDHLVPVDAHLAVAKASSGLMRGNRLADAVLGSRNPCPRAAGRLWTNCLSETNRKRQAEVGGRSNVQWDPKRAREC